MDDKEWAAGIEVALNEAVQCIKPEHLWAIMMVINHLGNHLPVTVAFSERFQEYHDRQQFNVALKAKALNKAVA